MSEWKRLTPDTITTTSEAKYRPIHEGLFSHHVEAGCCEISLSNAELNALACYAPAVKAREEQVQALVEDVAAIWEEIETDAAPFEPIYALEQMGKVTLDASLVIPLLQHLDNITEASGE